MRCVRHARRRAVPAAVGGVAQVGASSHHPAGAVPGTRGFTRGPLRCGCALNRSAHHSHTLPVMLNSPWPFGVKASTGAVHTYPSSAVFEEWPPGKRDQTVVADGLARRRPRRAVVRRSGVSSGCAGRSRAHGAGCWHLSCLTGPQTVRPPRGGRLRWRSPHHPGRGVPPRPRNRSRQHRRRRSPAGVVPARTLDA
jgi:hypothetical protein